MKESVRRVAILADCRENRNEFAACWRKSTLYSDFSGSQMELVYDFDDVYQLAYVHWSPRTGRHTATLLPDSPHWESEEEAIMSIPSIYRMLGDNDSWFATVR